VLNALSLFTYAPDHTSRAPSHLSDIVTQTATISSWPRLRSGNSGWCEQPRTPIKYGQQVFSYAAQSATNAATDLKYW